MTGAIHALYTHMLTSSSVLYASGCNSTYKLPLGVLVYPSSPQARNKQTTPTIVKCLVLELKVKLPVHGTGISLYKKRGRQYSKRRDLSQHRILAPREDTGVRSLLLRLGEHRYT